MTVEVLMPSLSPTMKEGTLAKWLKNEGDSIEPGDVIAEIETDKATMEVESVDEGILGKILVPEGSENIPVNSTIALILEDGESNASLEHFVKQDQKNTSSSPEEKISSLRKNKIKSDSKTEHLEKERLLISPLAKKIAQKANIEELLLKTLDGSGPYGRLVKSDIVRYIDKKEIIDSGSISDEIETQEGKKVKNNNIRKVIAKRLLESKQQIPHFYLSYEFNLDKLLRIRKEINSSSKICPKTNIPSYKISINDMIVKAVALAIKYNPKINSSWEEDYITLYSNIDISIAVAIEEGLITPIIKNADQKSLIRTSFEVKELVQKANSGKLKLEEFQGGTFSISNLGMYGVNNFNAIVNPPQTCILAVGSINERVTLKNDKFTNSNFLNVTLSCDHRAIDGVVAAEFLESLRNFIEEPIKLLINE